MEADHKKTALRMIPYGIYVLTATDGDDITAATVNWVTQTSFDPPLVVVGMKADSAAYAITKKSGSFALNILGKGQQGAAFAFFKPAQVTDGKISGEPYRNGGTGSPRDRKSYTALRNSLATSDWVTTSSLTTT